MRFANRAKGQRTPFEAFGKSLVIQGFHYDWGNHRSAGCKLAEKQELALCA